MKKLIIALLPLALVVSCKKDLTSINTDPKNPSVVPSSSLFTGAQKTVTDLLTSSNVNTNIFRLIVQYWTETTYTDESNYDLVTRQIPRQVWNGLYRDVLANLEQSKKVAQTDIKDAKTQKNAVAVAEIMEVFTWYYLVTTFGDVPYTEALNTTITQPKYDNQKTIYYDLLTRLDAAIGNLDESGDSWGGADIVYGGNVAAWKKFANSFKLKMGMTIADVDNAKAQSTVESAVKAGVFTSNADNAQFNYLSGPPNTNPIWVDLVQSGRKDFVATTTLVNKLTTLNDPRTPYFITYDASGSGFSGGKPGASNNYATFSKPSGPNLVPGSIGKVTNSDFPALLLSYDEVEFFLAEALERGYNVGGTAAQHYNNAITASIVYWGGTNTQADTYIAQPGVAYNAANWKKQIGEQKWLALYNRGWDEWIEWRRLDSPTLVAPPDAQSDVPLRFTYPIPEQNVNTANYKSASTAIGGDDVATKLFWDKF